MRQRLTGLLSVVSAFLVLASCGGGGPTKPEVTPTSITVNSTSAFIVLGQTETFTATIAFSNGTTQAVSGGTWGTDAATVATVGAATGLVSSVRSGDVTIFVDAQGIRGTKRITIVPNYQGIWGGTYVVNTCTHTGGFATGNYCGTVFPIGATPPVAFNFNQTGGNISGQTALGQLFSSLFLTTASLGGGLGFQAVAQLPTLGPPPLNFRVDQAWQINQAVAGTLTGTVVQTWTEPTLGGQMLVGATLQTTTRTSAQPVSLRLPGAPGWFADIASAIHGR